MLVGLAGRGVRSSVIRLAPMVCTSYLDRHGFTPALIAFAREHGTAAYVGEGANRWPAVDTRDAAVLYRLALEKGPRAPRLHAVEDEGIPFRTVAETIAARLGLEAKSVTPDEAPHYLGFLAHFAQLDGAVSNTRGRGASSAGRRPVPAGSRMSPRATTSPDGRRLTDVARRVAGALPTAPRREYGRSSTWRRRAGDHRDEQLARRVPRPRDTPRGRRHRHPPAEDQRPDARRPAGCAGAWTSPRRPAPRATRW